MRARVKCTGDTNLNYKESEIFVSEIWNLLYNHQRLFTTLIGGTLEPRVFII